MADDWVDVPSSAAPSPYAYYQQTGHIPVGGIKPQPVGRDTIVDFWKGVPGVSDHVAEGIADRLHVESGIRGQPNLYDPTAVNPASGAIGLAQDLGPRKTELQAQPNWQDPHVQLQNMLREVTGGDKIAAAHWNEIKNAPDRTTAAQLWTKYFERPEGTGWKTLGAPGWNVSDAALRYESTRADTDVRYVDPRDFLAMLPPIAPSETESAKRSSLMKSLSAGDDIEAIPTLDVKRQGDKLTVEDYDGRNRAQAAIDAGIDLIPVAIRGVSKGDPAAKEIQGLRGEGRPYDFQPVPPPLPKPQPPRSVLAGIREGIIDPLLGTAQAAQHVVPTAIEEPVNRALGYALPDMDKVLAQREAEITASRGPDAGFDWERAAGNIGAGVSMAALAPEVFGGSTLARLALSGAAQGAAAPVTDTSQGFAAPKAEQIGLGAVAAPAAGLAGRFAGQVLGPTFRPAVETLLNEGVRLTPGQLAGAPNLAGTVLRRGESGFGSVPIAGSMARLGMRRSIEDFNRAAWNRALRPIGEELPGNIPVGRDAMNYVECRIGDLYRQITPNLRGVADRDFMRDWSDIWNDAKSELPDQQLDRLDSLFRQQFVEKSSGKPIGRSLSGQELSGIDQRLGQEARGYRSDPSYDNRKLGDFIGNLHEAFRELLERQNPQFAAPLRSAREAYANFVRVARAASSIGAKDGVFTPAQLGNAVRSESHTVRKMGYGRGTALLQDLSDAGQQVLPSVVPDSGTPERLGLMGLLGGAAHFEPTTAVVGAAAMMPYTGAGMAALRGWATAFPQVRRMLGDVPRLTGTRLAPGLALSAGRLAPDAAVGQ